MFQHRDGTIPHPTQSQLRYIRLIQCLQGILQQDTPSRKA
jgi:hypothetical protein